VLATPGIVIVRILHEVDGEACAEVVVGDGPGAFTCVFSGVLELPSGCLRVGDAGGERTESVTLAPGVYSAAVLVDEVEHPELVVLVLNRR